jgi:hypothetical protein
MYGIHVWDIMQVWVKIHEYVWGIRIHVYVWNSFAGKVFCIHGIDIKYSREIFSREVILVFRRIYVCAQFLNKQVLAGTFSREIMLYSRNLCVCGAYSKIDCKK